MPDFTAVMQHDDNTSAILCVLEGRHTVYGPFRAIGRRFVAVVDCATPEDAATVVHGNPSLAVASPEVDHLSDGDSFTVLSLVEREDLRIVGAVVGSPQVHYRWSGMLSGLCEELVVASTANEACSRAEDDFYAAMSDRD